jgi:hypothetical protein
MSILDYSILLVLYSKHTDQVIVRGFIDDSQASDFIEFVVQHDPTIVIEFEKEKE